jgi:hypothetical protein
MPITPLHFGLLAPANHWLKGRISPWSFVLMNLWLDSLAIQAWFAGEPLPSHDRADHTFIIAMSMAVVLAVLGVRSAPWVAGAVTGAVSHILLDALVHPEMQPFKLMGIEGNPFYMNWMLPLSVLLTVLLCWFIGQSVSGSLGWARRRLAERRGPTAEPGL